MITHTIESYWIPSQKKTQSRLQILKIRQNMKWIRWVLLKIQSGHDSVHRRTDGQTDKVIPVYPPFNFVEAGGIIIKHKITPSNDELSNISWYKNWRIFQYTRWRHHMDTLCTLLAACEGNTPVTAGLFKKWTAMWSFIVFFVAGSLKPLLNTNELSVIWDVTTFVWRRYDIIVHWL